MFLEEDIDRDELGSRVSAHLAEQGMNAELRFTTISSAGAKDTYPVSTAALR
jgi:hypothetical protein